MEGTSGRTASIGTNLTFLLVGGGIGAVLALLFAPKSGSEFRGDIADATRKSFDSTLDKAREIKDISAEIGHTITEKSGELYDFAAQKLASGQAAAADAVASAKEVIAGEADDVKKKVQSVAKTASNQSAGSF